MDFSVSGQHVVVMGAGRSGVAAAELLVSRGAHVTVADAQDSIEAAPRLRASGVRVALGARSTDTLRGADLVVLSPGVPPDQPPIAAAREAGVPVIGEIELASRWLRGRVIAITGTKGKSTTTTLTAKMLEQAGFTVTAGGNLGTPLSAQVAASTADALHVVEVSSFQLEGTDTFHPWIAAVLNLSPDHLDRHASFEAYGAAKARIFANQTADDWAVVNADDAAAVALAAGSRAHRLDFGLDVPIACGVTVDGQQIVRRSNGETSVLLPVAAVKLPGRHLLSDVLAAASVASVAAVPPAAMLRAINGFTGLEHALEHVGRVRGVDFVNDSKATNIESARRSLESFPGGIVAIMGGRFKGGRFEDLQDAVSTRAVAVVAIGEAAPKIHAALDWVVPVHDADTMQAAVRQAFDMAPRDGIVLLAPGCSSFDMFSDYAARGRAFKEAVAALG